MSANLDDQLALPLPDPTHDATLARRVTPGWQAQAACHGVHGDVFFPEPDERGALVEAAALDVCNGCRVRSSCRATALLNGEQGIWGGTTEGDRDRMLSALTRGVSVDAVLVETIRTRASDEGAAA
ncbi:WhiB family transcriptional regulator [Nocardioidaceae bacterium SCSIO 66511]|nr:WhiB family transcriptional regulator [Nocardioidaceae bacterium SCSIO 66511]